MSKYSNDPIFIYILASIWISVFILDFNISVFILDFNMDAERMYLNLFFVILLYSLYSLLDTYSKNEKI